MTPDFFPSRRSGQGGLAVFLNAGDPPLDTLRELALLLDGLQVDCLELAVPFPNSVTDGDVIRRSSRRALEQGVELNHVLEFVRTTKPALSHLKVALLADWSHTVKALPLPKFVGRVQEAGCDGLLVHGLPPRLSNEYHEAARRLGQPIVTTCYASSRDDVLQSAGRHASAYVYLVAAYGRTGTTPPGGYEDLSPVIRALKETTGHPIAVGFGVKDRSDITAIHAAGADAAIVGSACVQRVEQALLGGDDVLESMHTFLLGLRGVRELESSSTIPTNEKRSQTSDRSYIVRRQDGRVGQRSEPSLSPRG